MLRRRHISVFGCCLVAVLCVLSSAFSAKGQKNYALDQCIELGLKQSARAVNSRRDLGIAETRIVQARSQALPQLSLTADYTRLDELQEIPLGSGAPIELGTLDNYSVLGQVRQLLYSGGQVRAALRAAGLARDLAKSSSADENASLVRDIKVGFNDILLAKAAVEVREASVDQLTAVVKQTEQKKQEGTASEFDVIAARVRLANEKPVLIAAKNTQKLAMLGFKRLVGLPDDDFDIVGRLEYEAVDCDVENLLQVAVSNRPALHVLEKEMRLRKEAVVSSQSQEKPQVSAFAQYNGANSYSFVSYDDDALEWHWSVGLAMSWNIWDGGLTHGLVDEKKLELAKSQTNLDDFRKQLKLQVEKAYLSLQSAKEAVEASRGNVELAEKGLSIAKARYDSGLGTYLELTEATVSLRIAKLSYYTAVHDHANALADLVYACGLDKNEWKQRRKQDDRE